MKLTKKEKIRKEICFADRGAGSYLYCSLWEMMEEHKVTMEDFHDQTDAWKRAVEASLCEASKCMPYEEVWPSIICRAFAEGSGGNDTAKETAENIKAYLIAKLERHLDKCVMTYPDDMKDANKPLMTVRISDMIGSGHELSLRDMDFQALISDDLVFNSKGRIKQEEEGCGKEDCCQNN